MAKVVNFQGRGLRVPLIADESSKVCGHQPSAWPLNPPASLDGKRAPSLPTTTTNPIEARDRSEKSYSL